MNTEILDSNTLYGLRRAAELLKAGDLVAVPTETVYGLAANASDSDAVKKIFAAKGRPSDHPLIVHISSIREISNWAVNVPEQAYLLGEAFWPGPLTLLLEKAPWVPMEVTGGHHTIALRVPAHPIMQKLLLLTELALAAPSANLYQYVSATTASHVYRGLGGKIHAILDGGPCAIGVESTIVDVRNQQPHILRFGPITANDIKSVLGQSVSSLLEHNIATSGNKKVHYKPNTPLYVMSADSIKKKLITTPEKIGLVLYSPALLTEVKNIIHKKTGNHVFVIQLPQEKTSYAAMMYSTLHELDMLDIDNIWLESPPTTDEWLDVNDRLTKAST